MKTWEQALGDAIATGAAASGASALALSVMSRIEAGHAAAALNGTSHWLWGDREAAAADEVSLRHTGVGAATHHASAYMWAVLHERFFGEFAERSTGNAVLAGLGTAAIACVIDYTVTPKRLTPGFELRLSKPALAVGFVALGLGIAAASIGRSRSRMMAEEAAIWPAG